MPDTSHDANPSPLDRPPSAGGNSPWFGRGFVLGVVVGFIIAVTGLLALLFGMTWTKGRPLRGRLRRRRTELSVHPQDERAAAAQHWRAMAQDEHESVATFAELALDLMAAGAPAGLVARCHEAALEEARHADACMVAASLLDGQAGRGLATPRALRTARCRPRWRTALVVRLAVESYVDGCVGESSSACVLARLARLAEADDLRTTLRTLAREEMGHADLAADIVAWCRKEEPALVDRAIAIFARRVGSQHVDLGGGRDLRPYGVPDPELRRVALSWAVDRAARICGVVR